MPRRALALGTLLASAALAAPAAAQIRASELASVAQTIDGTKLTVQYSRPRVRGRDSLFGNPKVVKWNEVWTPGANYATTLEASKDVTLDGRKIPAGKYSVWLVVRPGDTWTAVFDPKHRQFHMAFPDSNPTQIRFPVKKGAGPFTEALTWSFPDVHASGGTLAMQWGTTRVAFDVAVAPSLVVELPEADARAYLGSYETIDRDSTGKETRRSTTNILYENGTMKAEFVPRDPYMGRFALIRVGPDYFAPGLYDEKGKIYEVLRPDMIVKFRRDGGRVTGFEVRGEDDALWSTATRKP
jgi:hypothetical protein